MSDFLQDYGMVSYYADFFFNMFLFSLKRSRKDTYTVFDVGFNTGQFTRLASECFKAYKSMGEIHQDAKLRIVAFEPNAFLAKVAPEFEGLEVHVLALSNTIGTETLHIPLFDGEPHDLAEGAANHRNEYGGVYGVHPRCQHGTVYECQKRGRHKLLRLFRGVDHQPRQHHR